MPKGVYERKPKEEPMATETADKPSEKMFPVKLLKNYRPANPDKYEIVGYQRQEKRVKDSAGRETVVHEAAFMEGEMAPPPFAGVGFDTKIWAETVVRLPIDEARRLVGRKLAERADAIPG